MVPKTRPPFKYIAVYCGSRGGKRPEYTEGAVKLGSELVKRGSGLVYGGGTIGLMGVIAHTVEDGLGRDAVKGFIPSDMVRCSGSLIGNTVTVDSMHTRKLAMVEAADAFIAMPGGPGTLEELVEVLTWVQLGHLKKPVGILNIAGYYNHLVAHLNGMHEEGFCRDWREWCVCESDPVALLDKLEGFTVQSGGDLERYENGDEKPQVVFRSDVVG